MHTFWYLLVELCDRLCLQNLSPMQFIYIYANICEMCSVYVLANLITEICNSILILH